jgi:hypothetical protein
VALGASGALDADDLRPSINNPIPAHRGKGFVDGVFMVAIVLPPDMSTKFDLGACLLTTRRSRAS